MARQNFFLAALLIFLCLLPPQIIAQTEDAKQLLGEADRLAWLYNWQKAGPLYARAEKQSAQANDQRDQLYARCGRLRADMENGSWPEISDELTNELENPIVNNDPRLMLRCLATKGDVDREDDPESARAAWEKALDLAKGLGDEGWQARAEAELGVIAFLDGDLSKATNMVGTALLSAFARGDMPTLVIYGSLECNGLVEMGKADEALDFCERELKAAESVKDMGFPFMAYGGKARALVLLGREREARKVLEDALAKTRQLDMRLEQSQTLIVLGQQWAAAGDLQQAIQYFEQAGELSRANGFTHSIAWSMFEAAKAYRDAGDLQKAEDRATQAMRAMEQVSDKYHLPLHLALLADLKARRGELAQASELYDEATDVTEGMLINSPNLQQKSSLIVTMNDVYLGHFDLAATKLRDFGKAYEVLEAARGRSIADALRNQSEKDVLAGSTTVAARKELNRIQLALLRETDRSNRKKLLDRLFEIEQVLTPGINKPGTHLQKVATHPQPVSLTTLQGSLHPDEMVLEYVLDEPRSFCLHVTRGGAAVSVLPAGRKRIEHLVEKYLAEVRSRKRDAKTGEELYSLLLRPIPGADSKQRFIIVPDGKLHLLPFDSLTDERSRYVLDSHIVSYAPSATVLYLIRTVPATHRPTLPFLGIGDVQYAQGQVTATKKVASADPPSSSDPASANPFDLAGARLQDIPTTRDELIAASQVFGERSKMLLGRGATEAAFKAQPLADFEIIHIAAHGIASAKFPDRAALVLGSDPKSGEDGLLQVREIRNLSMNADLVTLSACDTAVGRLQGEEGIANLVRAFLFAGAKSVVASLWAASDDYTRTLMEHFYRHIAEGEDKSAALRQAKRDLIREFGDQAVRFYWAGFVMVGDGYRSIPISRERTP